MSYKPVPLDDVPSDVFDDAVGRAFDADYRRLGYDALSAIPDVWSEVREYYNNEAIRMLIDEGIAVDPDDDPDDDGDA